MCNNAGIVAGDVQPVYSFLSDLKFEVIVKGRQIRLCVG